MGRSFKVFDGSIRKEDFELGCEIRLLAHCFLNCVPHPVSIVWVDALPHILTAWKAVQRIKPPDSVALVGPINIQLRCRTIDPISATAQPLSLAQPRFAAAQPVLGPLALGQIEDERKAV